jgi:hypothetical protein
MVLCLAKFFLFFSAVAERIIIPQRHEEYKEEFCYKDKKEINYKLWHQDSKYNKQKIPPENWRDFKV